MKEQGNSHEQLESKINDLRSKLLLHIVNFTEALNDLREGPADQKEVNRAVQQATRLGAVTTDQAWVNALIKVGMNGNTISEVWNAKDEEDRKVRIDSDIS